MAEELKLIHSQTANSKIYPEAKNFYLDCAEKCVRDKWLTADEGGKIKKIYRSSARWKFFNILSSHECFMGNTFNRHIGRALRPSDL